MSLWKKHEKVCATCIYWSGKRDVDFNNIKVQCEEGNCHNSNGFYNMKTMQGFTCSKWTGYSK